MDAGEGRQSGDIVSAKKSSAQEEYYRYMLLQAKLQNLNPADGRAVDPLLTAQSEREVIELSILRKLMGITESSPEFSQVVDITGSRDRYEQARILSEVVYDKVRAETILSFYTPEKTSMETYFRDATKASMSGRLQKMAGGGGLAGLFGISAGEGGTLTTGSATSLADIKKAARSGIN